jgi:hypothetical protein
MNIQYAIRNWTEGRYIRPKAWRGMGWGLTIKHGLTIHRETGGPWVSLDVSEVLGEWEIVTEDVITNEQEERDSIRPSVRDVVDMNRKP